jgi:hypothetical protein
LCALEGLTADFNDAIEIAGSVVFWMDFIDAPWSRTNPIYNWKASAIIFTLDI